MTKMGMGRLLLELEPCSYGYSQITCRGPAPDLGKPYLAFLGTTETVGPFLMRPYPQIVSEAMGIGCANLGVKNSGPDVFLNDPELLQVAQQAEAVVLEVLGATNLSNPFYKVHPRRNDRVVQFHAPLYDLVPELDTTDIHFTGHLMDEIAQISLEAAEEVVIVLRKHWISRMKRMIAAIGRPVHLIRFVTDGPTGARYIDPMTLAPLTGPAASISRITPSAEARSAGTEDMIFQPHEHRAARAMLSAVAHQEAAHALIGVLGATRRTARTG